MKKIAVLFILTLFCALLLTGYAFRGLTGYALGESQYAAVQVGCLQNELEPPDAAALARLTKKGRWSEGTVDCVCNCVILFGETGPALYYNNELGILNDFGEDRSLILTAARRSEVNSILSQYTDLPQCSEDIWSFFIP